MGNLETVNAVTNNLESILKGKGVNFTQELFEDEEIKAPLIPYGRIIYRGEEFEYNHGEKPMYANIDIMIQVVLKEKNGKLLTLQLQTWIHNIRDSVKVEALNIEKLLHSKLVSRVDTVDNSTIDHKGEGLAVINYPVLIRYREIS